MDVRQSVDGQIKVVDSGETILFSPDWASANIPTYASLAPGIRIEMRLSDGTHQQRIVGTNNLNLIPEPWATAEYIVANFAALKAKHELDTAPVDKNKFATLSLETSAYASFEAAALLSPLCAQKLTKLQLIATTGIYAGDPAGLQRALLRILGEMRDAMAAEPGVTALTTAQIGEINNALEKAGVIGRL